MIERRPQNGPYLGPAKVRELPPGESGEDKKPAFRRSFDFGAKYNARRKAQSALKRKKSP